MKKQLSQNAFKRDLVIESVLKVRAWPDGKCGLNLYKTNPQRWKLLRKRARKDLDACLHRVDHDQRKLAHSKQKAKGLSEKKRLKTAQQEAEQPVIAFLQSHGVQIQGKKPGKPLALTLSHMQEYLRALKQQNKQVRIPAKRDLCLAELKKYM